MKIKRTLQRFILLVFIVLLTASAGLSLVTDDAQALVVPTVTSNPFQINITSMKASYSISGGSGYGERGIYYRKHNSNIWAKIKATYDDPYFVTISGLSPGTEYDIYGYCYYSGSATPAKSLVSTFKTLSGPSVSVLGVSQIKATSASADFHVDTKYYKCQVGYVLETAAGSIIRSVTLLSNVADPRDYDTELTGLKSSTDYRIKAFAKTSTQETVYSGYTYFKTLRFLIPQPTIIIRPSTTPAPSPTPTPSPSPTPKPSPTPSSSPTPTSASTESSETTDSTAATTAVTTESSQTSSLPTGEQTTAETSLNPSGSASQPAEVSGTPAASLSPTATDSAGPDNNSGSGSSNTILIVILAVIGAAMIGILIMLITRKKQN